MPKHDSKSEREVRNDYAKKMIKKYGFSLDELVAEFKRVKGYSHER